MDPDSNQQSKTSDTLRNTPLPVFEGMVNASTLQCLLKIMIEAHLSLWMSVIVCPVNSSNSLMLPGHTTSSRSSLTQRLIGVPQKRFRDTAQSRASLSQLANLFSFTFAGTLKRLMIKLVQLTNMFFHYSQEAAI